jgi:thiol-disulfide isomerase/thioredoxin
MQRRHFIVRCGAAGSVLAVLTLAHLANQTEVSDAAEGFCSLLGKPAPDFELQLLGGRKFHLAEAKNQVVVLDFWASWCEPCRQALPQVEGVVEGFKGRSVQLVAVNVRETQDQITAAFSDAQSQPTVALDSDGRVADLYGVTGIPQTLVIDRQGKVTRCFVGAIPDLAGSLRDAVQDALSKREPIPATAANGDGRDLEKR